MTGKWKTKRKAPDEDIESGFDSETNNDDDREPDAKKKRVKFSEEVEQQE